MSQFMLPVLASVFVPGCSMALLLWLDRLEETLEEAVQHRETEVAEPAGFDELSAMPGKLTDYGDPL